MRRRTGAGADLLAHFGAPAPVSPASRRHRRRRRLCRRLCRHVGIREDVHAEGRGPHHGELGAVHAQQKPAGTSPRLVDGPRAPHARNELRRTASLRARGVLRPSPTCAHSPSRVACPSLRVSTCQHVLNGCPTIPVRCKKADAVESAAASTSVARRGAIRREARVIIAPGGGGGCGKSCTRSPC